MFMTFCAVGLLNSQLLDRTLYLSRRLRVRPYPSLSLNTSISLLYKMFHTGTVGSSQGSV